mgnify:CR=1 FL=1
MVCWRPLSSNLIFSVWLYILVRSNVHNNPCMSMLLPLMNNARSVKQALVVVIAYSLILYGLCRFLFLSLSIGLAWRSITRKKTNHRKVWFRTSLSLLREVKMSVLCFSLYGLIFNIFPWVGSFLMLWGHKGMMEVIQMLLSNYASPKCSQLENMIKCCELNRYEKQLFQFVPQC